MKPKTAIFVDVQNIYYTTREIFNKQFNYRALWHLINQNNEVSFAIAYAIQRHDNKQIQFQDALRHIGFEVKLKPYLQRSDGTAKGDWDVGITIDMLELAKDLDKIILLSGDGDFSLLLDKVKTSYKVKTEVYSVQNLTSKQLIDTADKYHSIDESLLL